MKDIHNYELIDSMLSYDPESGVFVWNTNRGSARKGKEAGTVNSAGYIAICVGGIVYRAHRIAFYIMTGKFPDKTVDHINGDRTDNRWINLRSVGQSLNLKNAKISTSNKSGVVGVFWEKRNSRWRSIIVDFNGRYIYKSSRTLLDAVAWRKSKEKEYGHSETFGRKHRHVDEC